MKKLLGKNWVGVVCVILVALLSGIITGTTLTKAYQTYSPQFIQEVKQILPITIKDGEIISPKDTIIKKTYTFEDSKIPLDVVLDTRVDEFRSSFAPNGGIYITKKCLYAVNKNEVKANCFNDIIDELVIDEAFLTEKSALIEKYLGVGVAVILSVLLVIFYYIALLIYSLIIKLVLSIWIKCSFRQILLVNSLLYSVFELLSLSGALKSGFLIRLIIFTLANILILHRIKEENKQ